MSAGQDIQTDVEWVTLDGPLDYGFRLRTPMIVKLTHHPDGTIVVTDSVSTAYGAGETTSEALQDYRQTLAETFEMFLADEALIGPPLRDELTRLKALIVRD